MTPVVRQHHKRLRCYPQECNIFLKPIANVWHNLPIARIQTSRKQRYIPLTITAKKTYYRDIFLLPSPTNLVDLETLISKEEVLPPENSQPVKLEIGTRKEKHLYIALGN